MLFLHANGVGTSRAVRIYKTYGSDAVQVIRENPYGWRAIFAALAFAPPIRSRRSSGSRRPPWCGSAPGSATRWPRQRRRGIAGCPSRS